jgi:hypothetical protein
LLLRIMKCDSQILIWLSPILPNAVGVLKQVADTFGTSPLRLAYGRLVL